MQLFRLGHQLSLLSTAHYHRNPPLTREQPCENEMIVYAECDLVQEELYLSVLLTYMLFFPRSFIHSFSLSLFLNIYICPYMYIYIVLYRSPPCYWITVPGKSHVGATNRLYKIWSFTYYLYTCYMSSLDLPKWLVHRSEPVFFCSFTSLLIFASLLICFSIYR